MYNKSMYIEINNDYYVVQIKVAYNGQRLKMNLLML